MLTPFYLSPHGNLNTYIFRVSDIKMIGREYNATGIQYNRILTHKGDFLKKGSYYYTIMVSKEQNIHFDDEYLKGCYWRDEERFNNFISKYTPNPLHIVDYEVLYEKQKDYILKDVVDKGTLNCIYLHIYPEKDCPYNYNQWDFEKVLFLNNQTFFDTNSNINDAVCIMKEYIGKTILLNRIIIKFSRFFFVTEGGEIQNAASSKRIKNESGNEISSNYQFLYVSKNEDLKKINDLLSRVIEKKIKHNLFI